MSALNFLFKVRFVLDFALSTLAFCLTRNYDRISCLCFNVNTFFIYFFRYQVYLSDANVIVSLTTLLLNDLSTLKDTIAAGESKEEVLVIEISDAEASGEIQSLTLHTKLNDQTAETKLQ